jgi:putative transposase
VNGLHARDSRRYAVSPLCKLFGVTRQAYYKYDGSALMECVAREGFALEYMREIREKDPGIGILKLWYMYRRLFGPDHAVGRDRFGDIAERYGLKIRKKRRKPKTTDSRHGLPTYPDLTKELIPSRPNELWVSDITYITVGTDTWYRFCYLSLIMDAYTEEVIGWAVGDTLEAKLALEALRKALVRMEGGGPRARPIHHSDRGCQYASAEYVDMLRKSGVEISMTESGNPRDNARAERINGTVKNELLRGKTFTNTRQVRAAMETAVEFYNNERPHMSIDMMTPAEAARRTGDIPKRWKSYRDIAIRKNGQRGTDIPEGGLPPAPCKGSPSGLRPPVNPLQG